MLDIPGYRVLGTIQGHRLQRVVPRGARGRWAAGHHQDADGRLAGPRERREVPPGVRHPPAARDVRGVTRPYACERIHERPVLLLEEVAGRGPVGGRGQAPSRSARFLALAISLASTLAEVHRRGVIHKDIKPANIIVNDRPAR